MASAVMPRMVTILQSSRKFWRRALASSFGLPQNGLAYTMFMRLDFSSKFMSPTSTLGPVATLAAKGTEKSWRVFSAMGLMIVDGAWEAGSLVDCESGGGTTRGRTLLTSSRDFQQSMSAKRNQTYTTLFSSNQEKKKIHTFACISSSYLLLILPCLCA